MPRPAILSARLLLSPRACLVDVYPKDIGMNTTLFHWATTAACVVENRLSFAARDQKPYRTVIVKLSTSHIQPGH
jgi:hypothetical protein